MVNVRLLTNIGRLWTGSEVWSNAAILTHGERIAWVGPACLRLNFRSPAPGRQPAPGRPDGERAAAHQHRPALDRLRGVEQRRHPDPRRAHRLGGACLLALEFPVPGPRTAARPGEAGW